MKRRTGAGHLRNRTLRDASAVGLFIGGIILVIDFNQSWICTVPTCFAPPLVYQLLILGLVVIILSAVGLVWSFWKRRG